MYALCLGQNHFTTVLAKAVLGASYISEGDSEEGRKLIQDAVTWLLHHGYAADHPIVDKYSKLLSEKQVQKTVIANGIRSILLCVTKDE